MIDLGYYDSPGQPVDKPTRDCLTTACSICWRGWTPDTVRTISVMPVGGDKSGFYRVHRACHDALSPEGQEALDLEALAALAEISNSS